MRYQDFIDELRGHVAEAQRIREAGLTDGDPGFRAWRHRVESLVQEVATRGYRLPGKFKSSRRFYTDPYAQSEATCKAAFVKDITDTEIELAYLIDQYDRYGVPPLGGSPVALASPEPEQQPESVLPRPEHVTLHWLFKHVSVSGWFAVAGGASALLLIGATVGKTQWFQDLVTWFRSNWPF